MKERLIGGLYVGVVYAVGAYLGYRAGRSKGRLEMYCDMAREQHEKAMEELKRDHPELFEEEEES